MDRQRVALRAAAAGGVVALSYLLFSKARKRWLDAELLRQESEAKQQALLSAAHALEAFADDIVSQIHNGSLSVAEGVEKFAADAVRDVLKSTQPPLVVNMFKGSDPSWVFVRRLMFCTIRLACQPRVPRGQVKYVDFETGNIYPDLPPAPNGTMRVAVISDTHMRHRDVQLPKADVLLHCGDVLFMGGDPEPCGSNPWQPCLDDFLSWLNEQCRCCPRVIFVGGNHDGYLERLGPDGVRRQLPAHVSYLRDSEVQLTGGIRVYGTGFSCTHSKAKTGNTAFQNSDSKAVSQVMDAIPADIDVLITHGPPQVPAAPLGFKPPPWNQGCTNFGTYGSEQLAETVQTRVRPRVHVFGHVHEAHGANKVDGILYISASSVSSFRTTAENAPLVFDIPHRMNPKDFVSSD